MEHKSLNSRGYPCQRRTYQILGVSHVMRSLSPVGIVLFLKGFKIGNKDEVMGIKVFKLKELTPDYKSQKLISYAYECFSFSLDSGT